MAPCKSISRHLQLPDLQLIIQIQLTEADQVSSGVGYMLVTSMGVSICIKTAEHQEILETVIHENSLKR
jgi:hypothetical protein